MIAHGEDERRANMRRGRQDRESILLLPVRILHETNFQARRNEWRHFTPNDVSGKTNHRVNGLDSSPLQSGQGVTDQGLPQQRHQRFGKPRRRETQARTGPGHEHHRVGNFSRAQSR